MGVPGNQLVVVARTEKELIERFNAFKYFLSDIHFSSERPKINKKKPLAKYSIAVS